MSAPFAFDLSHPLRLDGSGRLAVADRGDHVDQMLRLALLTAPGERVNRPGFGAGLLRLIFEGEEAPFAALKLETRGYLQKLFRAILTVENLDLHRDGPMVSIAIAYRLVDGDERRVARFRFDDVSIAAAWADASARPERSAATDPLSVLAHRPLPWVDYLARDYASFLAVMLDRFGALVPGWAERNPADPGVTLIEALAYAADLLSYRQDAVGAEAHLATAQRRSSIARHARLRGVRLDEGCNARVWVRIGIAGPRRFHLRAGATLLTRIGDVAHALSSKMPAHALCLDPEPDAFMTLHDVDLSADNEEMPIVAAGAGRPTLPVGATAAVLTGHQGHLRRGDVLLLEAIAPSGSDGARQAVRVAAAPVLADADGKPVTHIRWFAADALVAELPAGHRAVARGNMVLADQGELAELALPTVPDDEPFRPFLDQPGLIWSVPFDADRALREAAAAAMAQPAGRSVAAIALDEQGAAGHRPRRRWSSRADLIGSGRFAPDFVAERHPSGVSLRFGAGAEIGGARPRPGTRFVARFRRAARRGGTTGPGAIAHLVTDRAALRDAVTIVTNPLASTTPRSPQTIESAKRSFPSLAIRSDYRDDPASLAALLRDQPEVADVAVLADTVAGRRRLVAYVLPVTLPVRGSLSLEADVARRLERLAAPLVAIGTEVVVRGPDLVPVDLALDVALRAGAGEVPARAAIEALVRGDVDGPFVRAARRMGAPLSLVDVIDAVIALPSVTGVEVRRFGDLARPGADALATGSIDCPPQAIVFPPGIAAPRLGRFELSFHREARA